MLVIFSEELDANTFISCAYLQRYGKEFLVILPNSEYDISFLMDNIQDISALWLRRGQLPKIKIGHESLDKECDVLHDYIHYLLENTENRIGSLQKAYNHNKLKDLQKAKAIGINTPESHIIFSKEQYWNIIDKSQKKWITKALKDIVHIEDAERISRAGFPSEIHWKELDEFEFYFPSFIQEKIEKEFEVRSFYIKGKFFSMAIFSQKNQRTELDYRNYDRQTPNRCIPFKLPEEIEFKLNLLMNKIEINTGSIDLIYSKNGEYYFLEVNPSGQYGWLSVNCNFYIDREIARILSYE